ncbi:Uncharacterized protein Fot_00329 [Forsythia ovata]|uniref:Uncharacterized protein n=1 Tax=Forsythia ovata TaxID=205694 RepID=A0ABD1X4Z8_9LAMI
MANPQLHCKSHKCILVAPVLSSSPSRGTTIYLTQLTNVFLHSCFNLQEMMQDLDSERRMGCRVKTRGGPKHCIHVRIWSYLASPFPQSFPFPSKYPNLKQLGYPFQILNVVPRDFFTEPSRSFLPQGHQQYWKLIESHCQHFKNVESS